MEKQTSSGKISKRMQKQTSVESQLKKSHRTSTENLSREESLTPRNTGIVKLNVGGVLYTTSTETLISKDRSKLNFFDLMLNGSVPTRKDENGAYFVDRDGTYIYLLTRNIH